MKSSEIAIRAKRASRRLAGASSADKNRALLGMADAIERRSEEILAENAADIAEGRSKGLSAALIDRLMLDESRLRGIGASLRRHSGPARSGGRGGRGSPHVRRVLRIEKVRVPFGVIAGGLRSAPQCDRGRRCACV